MRASPGHTDRGHDFDIGVNSDGAVGADLIIGASSCGDSSTGFDTVAVCADAPCMALNPVLDRYGIERIDVAPGEDIPGSYWGAPEAGLNGNRLYLRPDTPVHSALHELAHFVCMTSARRVTLDTDAGGDDEEECAVCYLQLVLAGEIAGFGTERCLREMDAWGYSFREGCAAAWFAGDGKFGRRWLGDRGLIDSAGRPTWRLRAD